MIGDDDRTGRRCPPAGADAGVLVVALAAGHAVERHP
jgi:hypothetical protein